MLQSSSRVSACAAHTCWCVWVVLYVCKYEYKLLTTKGLYTSLWTLHRRACKHTETGVLHFVGRMTCPISFYLGPVMSCCQEPLAEPREPVKLDTTCGDAELFQRFFFPNGDAAVCFLGDMWDDVTCLQDIFTILCVSSIFKFQYV